MKVILIRNYRRKLLTVILLAVFWTLMLVIAGILTENRLALSVTINNYLSFSHPISYTIDDVYFNEALPQKVKEAYFPFRKPIEFKSFKSEQGKFIFSYPEGYLLTPLDFGGGEILYHIDFSDNEKVVHGFVQVWRLPVPLSKFLEGSKANSTLAYKDFTETPVTVNGLNGYLWNYTVAGGTEPTKGMEVFLEKDGRMYRMSYFLPESKWDKEHKKIFMDMVKSLKVY